MDTQKLQRSNFVYETAVTKRPTWQRVLITIWTTLFICANGWFAICEPIHKRILHAISPAYSLSHKLFAYTEVTLLVMLSAVIATRAFGYVHHRWLEHVSPITRIDDFLRGLIGKNAAKKTGDAMRQVNQTHIKHHRDQYPYGVRFLRPGEYVSASGQHGLPWDWIIPGLIVAGLYIGVNGLLSIWTALWIATVALYSTQIISKLHDMFHIEEHRFISSWWFKVMFRIHVEHHRDEETNYEIDVPYMDFFCFTLRWPKSFEETVKDLSDQSMLSISELTNMRLVLLQATPAERAEMVLNACKAEGRKERHLRRMAALIDVLNDRLILHPEDKHAQLLKVRAVELEEMIKITPVRKPERPQIDRSDKSGK